MCFFSASSVGKMNGQMYVCMPHTGNSDMHMTRGH